MTLKYDVEEIAKNIPLMNERDKKYLIRILGGAAVPHPAPVLSHEAGRAYALAGYMTLTPREMEVLNSVVSAKTSKAIALMLGISHRTVEIHRTRVMQKMGARNVVELCNLYAAIRPAAHLE